MLTRTLIGCALLAALATPGRAGDELKPGDTLGKDTWQRAEGLLPPEILTHYKKDEYVNPIAEWPRRQVQLAAGPPRRHRRPTPGKFTTGPERRDPRQGHRQAAAVHHRPPFPTIDAADPAAGIKVLWNFFYRTWYFGNLHVDSQVNWIGPGGLERRADEEVRLRVLRRHPGGRADAQPGELPLPPARAGEGADRSERHRRAHLALPRSDATRLDLGIRARAATRARGEPRQPLRRLPRLRHEPGRRPLLRRQARGLRRGS